MLFGTGESEGQRSEDLGSERARPRDGDSAQALKEDRNLLKRPNSGDVINVCRHSKIIEAVRRFLQDGL
jgi:hypothetical protein